MISTIISNNQWGFWKRLSTVVFSFNHKDMRLIAPFFADQGSRQCSTLCLALMDYFSQLQHSIVLSRKSLSREKTANIPFRITRACLILMFNLCRFANNSTISLVDSPPQDKHGSTSEELFHDILAHHRFTPHKCIVQQTVYFNLKQTSSKTSC